MEIQQSGVRAIQELMILADKQHQGETLNSTGLKFAGEILPSGHILPDSPV